MYCSNTQLSIGLEWIKNVVYLKKKCCLPLSCGWMVRWVDDWTVIKSVVEISKFSNM